MVSVSIVSVPFSIRSMTLHTCIPVMAFSEAIFYISLAFWRQILLKSSDMYFEYSKCGAFCEFLIYVYEWFLFSLPWQRSVIFSPLQIVLMVKNEPLFIFLCIILQFWAVCKLLFYLHRWGDADFIRKPIALNLYVLW